MLVWNTGVEHLNRILSITRHINQDNCAPYFQIIIINYRQVHYQVCKFVWLQHCDIFSFLPSVVIFGWGAYAKPYAC